MADLGMADPTGRLGSKLGEKVADARRGDARGASLGFGRRRPWLAPALFAGLTVALLGGALACEGGAASALPDPGPSGVAFTVKSEPSGASVTVDGVAAGNAPVTVKLRAGPHRLRAAMSGYYPAPETRVQVGATEPAEVTLHLVASH